MDPSFVVIQFKLGLDCLGHARKLLDVTGSALLTTTVLLGRSVAFSHNPVPPVAIGLLGLYNCIGSIGVDLFFPADRPVPEKVML